MREIEWTEAAIADMVALAKGIARRIKQNVERFAATGAGSRCQRARFCLSAFEAIQIRLWFASRRIFASGQGARRPVRRPFCEQTRGSVLPSTPGSLLERAEVQRTGCQNFAHCVARNE